MRFGCCAIMLCSAAWSQAGLEALREQAWAAHRIAETRQQGQTAKLLEYLRSPDTRVQGAALDALVQTGARVAPEELARLADRFLATRIILLARHPSPDSALFQLLGQRYLSDTAWAAIHNVLAARKHPVIAGPLLRRIEFRVQVSIGAGGGSGGGVLEGGGWATGASPAPDGFPPPYYYILSARPEEGDVLAADGIHPIYYRRVQPGCHPFGGIDERRYAFDYIATLLEIAPSRMPLQLSQSVRVARESDVSAVRARFEGAIDSILDRLRGSGLLTESEAGSSRPKLTINVN